MKYSSDKDFDRFIRGLVRRGYVYKTGKRHGKLYCPNGRFLASVPCTPSDSKALTIFVGELKRRLGISAPTGTNPDLFDLSRLKGAIL